MIRRLRTTYWYLSSRCSNLLIRLSTNRRVRSESTNEVGYRLVGIKIFFRKAASES